MQARTKTPVAVRDALADEPERLREAAGGDGEPNPARLAQRQRVTEFLADAPEPEVVRYSGPVRLAIVLAAVITPWVLIALAVKALLNLLHL